MDKCILAAGKECLEVPKSRDIEQYNIRAELQSAGARVRGKECGGMGTTRWLRAGGCLEEELEC